MPDFLLIIIVLLIFLFLLFSGLYVHSVLLAIGGIGLFFLEGFSILDGFLGSGPFNSVASYTLTTIPLFVLMAQFILQSDIVKDLFEIANRLSRGHSSILGMLTIVVGGFLGAVSGSGTATSSALGQAAVPQLKEYGYRTEFAGAIAATGGSLSSIIPPSISLILYGVITETPVGNLFIAAFIPGALLMLIFALTVFFTYQFTTKKDAESNENIVKKQMELSPYRVFVAVSITFFIIIVIFGGIYSGIMTPTEAGGVGAFAAFLTAILLRKVNWTFIKNSLVNTLNVNIMVMLIFIGADIFGQFVSLSLIPRRLINLIDPLLEYPVLVLIIIGAILFIMFMFIEAAAVILMTLPVMLPILETMNIDILWFGIFAVFLAAIGMITPPVGLSVYGVSGPTRIPSESIFKYTMVFALVSAVSMGALLILFPEIALWLPSIMD